MCFDFSPDNRDNPFVADGELRRKADYILRHSDFSRSGIRIADPDVLRPVRSPDTAAATAERTDADRLRPAAATRSPGPAATSTTSSMCQPLSAAEIAVTSGVTAATATTGVDSSVEDIIAVPPKNTTSLPPPPPPPPPLWSQQRPTAVVTSGSVAPAVLSATPPTTAVVRENGKKKNKDDRRSCEVTRTDKDEDGGDAGRWKKNDRVTSGGERCSCCVVQ